MQKIILFLLFSSAYCFSNAQIKKGALLIGGQISMNAANNKNTNSNAESENNGAGLTLSVGKFFKDNQVLGGYIGFANNNSKNVSNGNILQEGKFTSYNAGIFYRHYTTLAKRFYFFGEVNGGFNTSKQTQKNTGSNATTTTQSSGVNIGLTPGISYQIYKKLQLELLMPSIVGLGYSNSKTTFQNNTTKNSSVSFHTNAGGSFFNNLGLGFRFVL